MAKCSSGWAVELTGDKIDLDDFRQFLTHPFDPWIEDYGTDDGLKPLLRSASWVSLTEAADVFRDATRMIERLNGEALLIHGDAKPVELGQVMRFNPDGHREPIIFAAPLQLRVTLGRIRGRVSAVTSESPKPPEESRIQKWFREAESCDTRADLFALLNHADKWTDLYKVMELGQKLIGGPRALKEVISSDAWKEWERIWQTANCYRHAPNPKKYPLPSPPPELEAARDAVLKVIVSLLD